MIYVDTNAFLYLFSYPEQSAERNRAVSLIDSLLKEKETFLTASLTWDELAYVIQKEHGHEAAMRESDKLFIFPRLSIAPVSQATIKLARTFFESGLKPRDAIHAACALENHCTKIISGDPHFDKVKGLKRIPI